jgi:hypothetical protein
VTSGALASGSATIAGTAAHQHVTAGALAADASTLAGTADHRTLHATSGALASDAAEIAGIAAHAHVASGALAADTAAINGSAAHAASSHATSGALQADPAQLSGVAVHGGGSSLLDAKYQGRQNVRVRWLEHAEPVPEPEIAKPWEADPIVRPAHANGGRLVAAAATMRGEARRMHKHDAFGALRADAASLQAAPHLYRLHIVSGRLVAQAATMQGKAQPRYGELNERLEAALAELAMLKAVVIPPLRDPIADGLESILPALREPIDLDALPEPPKPRKMRREEIDRENERRAALAAEQLL